LRIEVPVNIGLGRIMKPGKRGIVEGAGGKSKAGQKNGKTQVQNAKHNVSFA
jgi:hypothetical protein